MSESSIKKVKCIFTLDEIDDSYNWDGENGAERMFTSVYIHVDEYVDEIKQPVVGNTYYYEHCEAPYKILSVNSLNDFYKRQISQNSDEDKQHIIDYMTQLCELGVKYWVSLKLMPLDNYSYKKREKSLFDILIERGKAEAEGKRHKSFMQYKKKL